MPTAVVRRYYNSSSQDAWVWTFRHDATSRPRNLSLVFGISVGDKLGRGTDALAKVSDRRALESEYDSFRRREGRGQIKQYDV